MADPDFKIRGEHGHPDPEIRGGVSKKKFFLPFGPQIGLKIRDGRAPPLDPPLRMRYFQIKQG